jgi:hypothetical protein
MKNSQNSNLLSAKKAAWILLFLEPALVLYILFMTYGEYTWDSKYNSTEKGIMIVASIVVLTCCIPSFVRSVKTIRS